MMIKKILTVVYPVLFLFISLPLSAQSLELVDTIDFEFDPQNTYSKFNANDEYLVWIDRTFLELAIHNLKEGTTELLPLSEGRGPHEIQQVTDLAIDENNRVFIADHGNSKVVTWNIDAQSYEDDIILRAAPMNIEAGDDMMYSFSLINLDNPVTVTNLKTGEQTNPTLENDFLENSDRIAQIFMRRGSLLLLDDILLHLSRYKNVLTTLSFEEAYARLFAESRVVAESEEVNYEDQAEALSKERRLVVPNPELQAMSIVDLNGEMYLLLKDSREDGLYSNSALYSIDKDGKLIHPEEHKAIEISHPIKSVTANSSRIFVYAEEAGTLRVLSERAGTP